MLIISKRDKKDYYDGVVGTMGIDKTIIYDREEKELEGINLPRIFRQPKFINKKDINPFTNLGANWVKKAYRNDIKHYSYFVIGFCGKLYIGFKFFSNTYGNITSISTTYDFDMIKNIIEDKGFYCDLNNDYNYILNYDPMDIFRELKTPIFVYDSDHNRTNIDLRIIRSNSKFIVNPLLKDYDFYKVFDSFQAFQEIQMFLGGVLGMGEKEIVQVADKYKIEQYGFDKHSFRKDKE